MMRRKSSLAQELEEGELCECGLQATTTCHVCLTPLCARCARHHQASDCLAAFEPLGKVAEFG
jgi:hypothetical protein